MRVIDKKPKQQFLIPEHDITYLASPTNNHFVLHQKLGYEFFYLGNRARVAIKTLKESFEEVINAPHLHFDKKQNKYIAFSSLYYNSTADFYIEVDYVEEIIEDQEDYEIHSFHNLPEGFMAVNKLFVNTEKGIDKVMDVVNSLLEYNPESSKKVSLAFKTTKGYEFKEFPLKVPTVDVDTMYNSDFKEVYDTVVDRLQNSDKGVILFHGEPGTGKTNLIKHLTEVVPNKKFIFIQANMIPYLGDPVFVAALIENKGGVLILEDSENYIKSRKNENGFNGVVTTILNMTDGLLSDVMGVQVICTFNSTVNEIDDALLRKGRLIAEYKFEALKEETATKLCDSLGIALGDVQGEHTLTNIFNATQKVLRSVKDKKTIGFGSNKT